MQCHSKKSAIFQQETNNRNSQIWTRPARTPKSEISDAEINNALKHMDEQATKIETNLLANPEIKKSFGKASTNESKKQNKNKTAR